MSISKKKLTIIIVTFKSHKVIHNCLKSIPEQINIIIVDNSNDKKFKNNIEKSYRNVTCILSSKNLGMGSGNNLGLKHVKTDFALILNPDVILEKNAIEQIIISSKQIREFGILAPLSKNSKYPNYKLNKKKGHNFNNRDPFKVESVDGYAMLLNLKRLNKLILFRNFNYFDENIFMYLENDDLCKKVINSKENIYIIPSSKITHLGGKATEKKYAYEIELSRNWHWCWSKIYFHKKHYGLWIAIKKNFPSLFSALVKYLIYLITLNKKKNIYLKRLSGIVNSFLGKKSWYRPKI